ncbi:hypothetical protein ACFX1X_003206 [Malus domestica]
MCLDICNKLILTFHRSVYYIIVVLSLCNLLIEIMEDGWVQCDKFARQGWWRGFRGGRSMEDPSILIRGPCRSASGAPCDEIGLTYDEISKELN